MGENAIHKWDDLRYVLAISRSAGLNPAAKALGVNASSVYRRLEAMEERMGVRLFERLRSGYRLTEAGEALAEAAERMEAEVLAVERQVLGSDVRLEGHIRLSSSEAFAFYVLPEMLLEFRRQYPGVRLDLLVSNQIVDLGRRDADVVIRATLTPPEHLVGRSVGEIGFACYATPRYLDRHGRGRALADYEWIGFDGALSHIAQARWMQREIPDAQQVLRCDSFGAALEAVACEVGVGALPCAVADRDPRFERLADSHIATGMQVWVLTHPDLRRSARVRACLQFFGTRLAAQAQRILGAQES